MYNSLNESSGCIESLKNNFHFRLKVVVFLERQGKIFLSLYFNK